MIALERAPDLKAAIAPVSFSVSIPTIDGMPLSRPSSRWQAAQVAASSAPRSLSAAMPRFALRIVRPTAIEAAMNCRTPDAFASL